MVLSLTDICLVSLRDSVENGKAQNWHLVPPKLRQMVLDMVLMHGTINEDNCLRQLSSVEFLDGFTSFSTQSGYFEEEKYLTRVAETMALILPNGQTMGSDILRLDLAIGVHPKSSRVTVQHIAHLVAVCPNLISLAVRENDLGFLFAD